VGLAVVAKTQAHHDQKNNVELADRVIEELKTDQFDALD
jgi:hypothetical protein